MTPASSIIGPHDLPSPGHVVDRTTGETVLVRPAFDDSDYEVERAGLAVIHAMQEARREAARIAVMHGTKLISGGPDGVHEVDPRQFLE
ncbi:MAG TPA: hypothetical protein VHE81_19855 [Lacipirellulaceae bacterium]|nr:hypothetical protein [Lacipirellulaceae bacterium]